MESRFADTVECCQYVTPPQLYKSIEHYLRPLFINSILYKSTLELDFGEITIFQSPSP